MTDRDSLALAERAAREGGRFLSGVPRSERTPVAETARDVKLNADRAAEDRIVRVLTKHSSIPILAEERSMDAADSSTAGLRWIVDPLDGTMNYWQGIPFCCVSVALWRGHESVAGAVYDFDRDEMFSAIVGAGAWLNGAPVTVRQAAIEKAVLCTGFPAGTVFTEPAISRFVQQVIGFRKVRMLGSAALSLAYVAVGRADAYFERDIKIWDVAAGIALVRAAGGDVLQASSPRAHALTVYAHNGACPWPEEVFE